MAADFRFFISHLGSYPYRKSALQKEQRDWLRKREECMKSPSEKPQDDVKCLQNLYFDRIDEMREIPYESMPVQAGTDHPLSPQRQNILYGFKYRWKDDEQVRIGGLPKKWVDLYDQGDGFHKLYPMDNSWRTSDDRTICLDPLKLSTSNFILYGGRGNANADLCKARGVLLTDHEYAVVIDIDCRDQDWENTVDEISASIELPEGVHPISAFCKETWEHISR